MTPLGKLIMRIMRKIDHEEIIKKKLPVDLFYLNPVHTNMPALRGGLQGPGLASSYLKKKNQCKQEWRKFYTWALHALGPFCKKIESFKINVGGLLTLSI